MSVERRRTAAVLDAHALWLEAVEGVLCKIEFDVVLKATTTVDVLRALPATRPDLLVMDITPDREPEGLALLAQVAHVAPSTRTVVLSASTDAGVIHAALAAGAAGYVLKSAHPDDLAAAIRQTFDHSIYLAHSFETVERMGVAVSSAAAVDQAALTKREREILRLVAEGHSNAELARMLWVTEQTVKFHLSNVYRKLEVSNRTEAARWAQVNGLLPGAPVLGRRLTAA
jgi:DNA-binding NarL/FixJ family response regulator